MHCYYHIEICECMFSYWLHIFCIYVLDFDVNISTVAAFSRFQRNILHAELLLRLYTAFLCMCNGRSNHIPMYLLNLSNFICLLFGRNLKSWEIRIISLREKKNLFTIMAKKRPKTGTVQLQSFIYFSCNPVNLSPKGGMSHLIILVNHFPSKLKVAIP